MNYKAIVAGKTGTRVLVPEAELFDKYSEMLESRPDKDFYISIFKYNQRHYDEYTKTKTLAGIDDNVSNKLVFDFDDKKDIENARQDTITAVNRLKDLGFNPEDINVYFTGKKGFHIEIGLDKDFTKTQLETIRQSISGDLNTTDPSIKDTQRILRAPLSKHDETGLFKILLSHQELTDDSIDDIKTEAANPSEDRCQFMCDTFTQKVSAPKKLMELSTLVVPKKVEVPEVVGDKLDFSRNKTGLTNAKYALSEGFFEEGERNEATMILASTYMGLGFHKELAYNSLKATYRLRALRLGLPLDTEDRGKLWDCIEHVYSPLWKGGMYSEDTNALLIKTKKRYSIEDKYDKNLLIKLSQVNNIFSDFATNIDKNTLKLGIPSFDEEIRVTTSTLVSILAAPSAGKSSISFGILNSTSKAGIKSMFFSLDMAAPQVYQRLAQRHTGYHSDRLFTAYQKRDMAIIEKVESTLDVEYSNVKFCFRGAMNVDIIREALVKEKELTGEFPKLIVVDYLENVLTDLSNDPTIAKGFVARSLKDIANEFAICVILLTQPAKVTGGPAEELNSYFNIKGSGLVAEASAQVITMHRPGFDPKNPADDNFITLTVVKNRMGTLGTFDYHWEGVRGTIRELMDEEKATLKVVRAQNLAKKKGVDDI